MKARLYKLENSSWFVVYSPENDLFKNEEIISDEYAKKFAIPIYKLKNIPIEIINKWNKNQFVEGYLQRENKKTYFCIENIPYIEIEEKEEIISKANIAIEAILGNFQQVAITLAQFEYVKNLAERENSITAKFTNGFSVNYKYIVFGKLTKKGNIIYPQIKRK